MTPTAPFIASITEHVAARGPHDARRAARAREWARPPSRGTSTTTRIATRPRASWTPWGYAQSLEGGVKLKRPLYALAPAVFVSARHACRRLDATSGSTSSTRTGSSRTASSQRASATRRGIPARRHACTGRTSLVAEQKPWLGRLARRAFARARWSPRRATTFSTARAGSVRRVISSSSRGVPTPMSFVPIPRARSGCVACTASPSSDVLVLGVGRFVRWKGFDDLIDERRTAREEVPTLRLVLVGDGDIRGELEAQARRSASRTSSCSRAWPRVTDVNAYLSVADIVAVPSVTRTASSTACRTSRSRRWPRESPSSSTRVGGLPELVRPGENGLLVAGEGLRRALRRRSSRSRAIRRFGRGWVRTAARSMRETLSWDAVADERLLRGGRAQPQRMTS